MRITYDAAADAAYVHLSKSSGSVRTEQVDEDIYIDFNEQDQMTGIEVLSASKRLLIPEIESVMTGIDTHWSRLSAALQSRDAQDSPIAASKRCGNYKVKEVGLDYVTLLDEQQVMRKITARQLLVPQPSDPLIETLRALGNYPEDQYEVQAQ